MFRVKVHQDGREMLVAASDADIVGKTFRENNLRITVYEAFYGGAEHEAGEEQLVARLRMCTVANLVGERAVDVAIRHGFVAPDRVIRIQGVPHAQLAVL